MLITVSAFMFWTWRVIPMPSARFDPLEPIKMKCLFIRNREPYRKKPPNRSRLI